LKTTIEFACRNFTRNWLVQWEMGRGVGLVREGETGRDRERRAGQPQEIRPKELREYRKEFLISRM
jgi:hypothetical protein